MKKTTKRKLSRVGLLVTAIGGFVHLLQPLGYNILSWFGGFSGWVQGIAGAVTLMTVLTGWKMAKR